MNNNNLYKKKYIEAFIEKVYDDDKINYLFPEPISAFKQYALDMFLDTNLTEEQVADNMNWLVLERKKLYDENIRREKRKQDICNIVLNVYSENQGLFNKSLEDMQNDYIELYLDNDSIKIEDIENNLNQTVSELRERQGSKAKEVQPIVLEYESENISFEETPTTNNEINDMLEESSNNNLDVVTDKKEVTKVKKMDEKQSGSISLFSIGVSILAVTAFILIALILNVLLK